MKPRHLLLLFLLAHNGTASKKRLLAEICLLSFVFECDVGFRCLYYGPYSTDIEEAITELIGAGFVRSSWTKLNDAMWEWAYTLSLTKEGWFLASDTAKDRSVFEVVERVVRGVRTLDDDEISALAKAAMLVGGLTDVDKVEEELQGIEWYKGDVSCAVSCVGSIVQG